MEVVRSGKWGRLLGDRTTTIEERFAEFQGARFGIAVANGSVALRLALLALELPAGAEVIVPPYTFSATAVSVVEANALPIFADIDPDTYCIDPDSIEAAITPNTRAIIPVHLGGQAADMDRIMEIAKQHNLAVVEDAAHAHGAAYKGRGLGAIGDYGCFSFQASKNLTSGEGGMVLTNDPELEERCRALHHCGRRKGGGWYEHPTLGGNYRLSELQSALLLTQLDRLEEQTERRNANGLYLNSLLEEIPGIRPMARDRGETRHCYHLYAFRYDAAAFDGIPRSSFVAALRAEGIPASEGYTVPLYRQEVFQHKAFGPYCPVCERASTQEGCWLPQTAMLAERSDMDDVAQAIAKVYENRAELTQKP
jgi:dTDP-4-amino-4,6-dideoxygalactose transaminase